MTRQEYLERIEKLNTKISKIEKRIKKWSTGMCEEAIEIAKNKAENKIDYATYKTYEKANLYNPQVINQDDWNKGPNIGELYRAYCDLNEANNTLSKYQSKIDEIDNFENEEKIPAIWEFLQNWKEKTYQYIIENNELLTTLNNNYESALEEFRKNTEGFELMNWREKYRLESQFKQDYYSDIHSLTYVVRDYKGNVDTAKLNKVLNEDVKVKYQDLVHRITEKAGVIQDASDLHIGAKGEINGKVIGNKNTVWVETVSAGGYNVQIFHYRTLVNIVK